MTDAQKLKEIIEYCGIVGSKVLSHEAKGEQYKNALLQLLDIMKRISPEDIKAARYPANIESTRLMDRYLIDGTVTEERPALTAFNAGNICILQQRRPSGT